MDELKTIKSYPFSGKKKDFKMWQIKFQAYLTYHKCIDIITDDTYKAPTKATVLDPANSAHKPEIAKRDQNIRAFMLLTLAMTDAVSFEAVDSSKTADLPDGDAKLAWTTLNNIYQPSNKSELQALRQQFNHCALTDASYPPDKWFAKLETLKIEMKNMKHVIDDDVMIAQILFNTQPSIYNTTIEILTREQSIGTAVPTLLQIKNEFRQVYSKYILTHGKKTNETALTAQTSHNNYNSNKNNSGNSGRKLTKKFIGDCKQCGKKGHKSSDCWEKDANKNKRPNKKQLMWQPLQLVNTTVDIATKTITLKTDASRRRKIKKRRTLGERWHYAFMKLH
jgi:gag-polypeptide of LTR copia-type